MCGRFACAGKRKGQVRSCRVEASRGEEENTVRKKRGGKDVK
jgi:hypothetical protein